MAISSSIILPDSSGLGLNSAIPKDTSLVHQPINIFPFYSLLFLILVVVRWLYNQLCALLTPQKSEK